ncbi:hypothetical protein H0H81_005769 [Sphagnurus paluster]|uniref:Uncharacterized protein n=1 Tax=Sphagnurus paluster TaxID=117069 RepID=A0A9P7GSL5_9AGAR|nr:hypothetical protein H0H81_005769 [Sphagnurus paluster]
MSLPQLKVPPSAVFILPYDFKSQLKVPSSPTASVRGVFVRSRPTSAFSEYEYNGIGDVGAGNISSEEESGDTSPDTDDILGEHEIWPPTPTQSDARSLAPSTFTVSSRVRIVRRSDAEADQAATAAVHASHIDADDARSTLTKADKGLRRRTWPSYKAIRKTVSNILHRKDAPSRAVVKGGAAGELAAALAEPEFGAPTERIKSSSVSLFSSRRRRRATTDAGLDQPISQPQAQVKAPRAQAPRVASLDAMAYRAQLRRSRSFSGFTNVLGPIDDDDEIDEATAEARDLVAAIGRRWAFEDVMEEDEARGIAGFLLERSVEH